MNQPFTSTVERVRLNAQQLADAIAYTLLVDGDEQEAHLTYRELDRQARMKTDTQAALEMQVAKRKLFAGFHDRRSA